jgi:hypothetical protein
MERGAAFKGRAKAMPKTAASRLDKSLFMALSFARALRCATEAEPPMNAAVPARATVAGVAAARKIIPCGEQRATAFGEIRNIGALA